MRSVTSHLRVFIDGSGRCVIPQHDIGGFGSLQTADP